jgi:hypothetical protein
LGRIQIISRPERPTESIMSEYKFTPRRNGKQMTTLRVDIHLSKEELEALLKVAAKFGHTGIEPRNLLALWAKESLDIAISNDEDEEEPGPRSYKRG